VLRVGLGVGLGCGFACGLAAQARRTATVNIAKLELGRQNHEPHGNSRMSIRRTATRHAPGARSVPNLSSAASHMPEHGNLQNAAKCGLPSSNSVRAAQQQQTYMLGSSHSVAGANVCDAWTRLVLTHCGASCEAWRAALRPSAIVGGRWSHAPQAACAPHEGRGRRTAERSACRRRQQSRSSITQSHVPFIVLNSC